MQVPKIYFSERSDTVPGSQCHSCECGSHHMVTTCRWSILEFFGCVLQTLEGGNGVSPLLPLNVQNCQREAAIWQPTKRTERVKTSKFLSYIGVVDDRLNPPKKCSFPLMKNSTESGYGNKKSNEQHCWATSVEMFIGLCSPVYLGYKLNTNESSTNNIRWNWGHLKGQKLKLLCPHVIN